MEITVLFTDTHFGVKNNSITWLQSQLDFIYKQFIPELTELKRTHPKDRINLIHLGDVFDSRSTISTYIATKVVKIFSDIRSECDEFIIVCGNHDFYSPNSDTVNTVTLLFGNLDIIIVDQEIYETDDHSFIPWYVWESGEVEVNGKYVFCHADIFHDVIPDSCIGKNIFSGHIHTPLCRPKRGLYNLGSCYSLNFADSNSERGFYIIKNHEVSFEKNTVSIKFYRLYNEEILNADLSEYSDDDYIELYATETNLSREDYISTIKKFTDKFNHLWIIPQVSVGAEALNEDFKQYDIESIIESMVPEDLQEFYETLKKRINQ